MRFLAMVCALALSSTPSAAEPALKLGIVVFDGFLTSEVTAPLEVFAKASSKGTTKFEPFTVAAQKAAVASEEGLRLAPDYDFATCPPLDVLLVPSALDMEPLLADEGLVAFIRSRAAEADYVASNCAGAFLLGKARLLEGRRITTYIGGAEDLKKMFPKARVIGDQHIVVDGNLISSIGGVTSYDAALTLLARITSDELADKVAKALYYFPWLEKPHLAPER